MEELNSFQVIVSIIIVFGLLALTLTVQWWRSQLVRRICLARRMLQKINKNLEALTNLAQAYSSEDPEPYGSQARELNAILQQVQVLYDECKVRHRDVLQKMPTCPRIPVDARARRIRLLICRIRNYPHWWHLRLDIKAFEQSIQRLVECKDQAQIQLETLQYMPIDLAARAKTIREVCRATLAISQRLYDIGLHGETLDTATVMVRSLAADLSQIPAYFFEDKEELILASASKETDAITWQSLKKIEPTLQEYCKKFEQWQSSHQELGQKISSMRTLVGTARVKFNHLLSLVALPDDLKNKLEQLETGAGILEKQYLQPTVELLSELSKHVTWIDKVSTQLAIEVDKIQQQADSLNNAILANNRLVAKIHTKINELATAEPYPIIWHQSALDLKRLRQLETSIGRARIVRTLPQLRDGLSQITVLEEQAKELAGRVAAAETLRAEVVSLLEKSQLVTGLSWLQVESLQSRVSKYALDNWSRSDAPENLLRDARILIKAYEETMPGSNKSLPENQLALMQEHLPTLIRKLENFKKRRDRIEEKLTSLQQDETEAKQKLDNTLKALGRLGGLWYNFGVRADVDSQIQEIDRLREAGQQWQVRLDQRQTGRVGDKANGIIRWGKKCEQAIQGLRKQLQTELATAKQNLNIKVSKLKAITAFDREPSMARAMRTLHVQFENTVPLAVPEQSQIDQMVNETYELLGKLKEVHESSQELGKQIEHPIGNAPVILDNVRQAATDKIEQLSKTYKMSKRNWPPITCDFDRLSYNFQHNETILEELKKSGDSMRYVRTCLYDLIKSYNKMVNEADEKLADIRKQQETLLDLEKEIDRRVKILSSRYLSNVTSADPQIVSGVQDQLAEIRARLSEIKNEHALKPLPYDKAERRLKEIWEDARRI